jgi:diaminopimelate decarboxylase
MMGSVIRRNWRIANVSNPVGERERYTVVGPLCTTIDTLATKLELPHLEIGNVIAIENSGAYGLTSSPTRFISHPEPREAIIEAGKLTDVSESLLNHWRLADN